MTTHSFAIADAEQHGLPAAVLLYNLRFWIGHNRANERHQRDGRTWTFNSAKAFAELFPYLSEDQRANLGSGVRRQAGSMRKAVAVG
ncbi:hypothetical protein [Burkholderia anthina]|uniref:hypothetical protein n=1 Tax=Burkholderia anthina TaxID=179879 RepID=UPI00158CEA0C|nr:hypothetical protein [Burkholderia anthina]